MALAYPSTKEEEMQGLQSFILMKQVKAKINFKNKPQHLNKQVHNTFRLQSVRHAASCSEFAWPRAAAQSTQGRGHSPGLPGAITTAEDSAADGTAHLISGRPLASLLTFMPHNSP